MTTNQNETKQKQIPNGHDPEDYLTKEELAKRLKKTVRTIENWQRRGLLPFVKIEYSVLFYWPDVKAHLQGNFRVMRKRLAKG